MRQDLSAALKSSMRERNARAVATIRLILAAIKDRDIAARTANGSEGISDAEIMQLLQKMVKQRQESIALYEQGGRLELAEQEREEIGIIESFLPRRMDEEETRDAVTEAIRDMGAEGIKDMSRVMAALRDRYPGRMDFGLASGLAKGRLC